MNGSTRNVWRVVVVTALAEYRCDRDQRRTACPDRGNDWNQGEAARSRCVSLLVAGLLLAGVVSPLFGCGDPSQPAVAESVAAAAAESAPIEPLQGPVGTWQRHLRNDVGPDPLIVMKLNADGTYTMSGIPMVEDRGTYTLANYVIAFTSHVSPTRNRLLAVRMVRDNELTLFTDIPFRYEEVWARKARVMSPFPSVKVNGVEVPEGLPVLMVSALTTRARAWHEDALPTWIRVERTTSGRYQLTLHFHSPSSAQEMRIRVTEDGISESVHNGSRTMSEPLPMIFMDLPDLVSAARAEGFSGVLKEADVRVHPGHGAAWMAAFDGARTGVTFSARTGERIEGDVTGYVQQYEAGWNEMQALWQQATASLGGSGGYEEYCRSITTRSSCEMSGCNWSGGSLVTGEHCHPDMWLDELNARNPDRWKVFLDPPDVWGMVEEPEHWRKKN